MDLKVLKLPPNKQGIAIDILVIVLNIALFPVVTGRIVDLYQRSLDDNESGFTTLAGLMIVVLVGRLGGLYLKRFPLQRRLGGSEARFSIFFFIFNVPIMVLTAVFGAVLIQYAAADIGWIAKGINGVPKESRAASMLVVFSVLIICCLEIYFLYRLGKDLNIEERQQAANGNWKFTFAGEFIADFGLFLYMLVWQVFYFYISGIFLSPVEGANWGWDMKAFSFGFMILTFMLFYVAPRAVFLTEDRKYFATWAFILLVFLTSLLPK